MPKYSSNITVHQSSLLNHIVKNLCNSQHSIRHYAIYDGQRILQRPDLAELVAKRAEEMENTLPDHWQTERLPDLIERLKNSIKRGTDIREDQITTTDHGQTEAFLDFPIGLTEKEHQRLESGSFFDSDSDTELEEVGNSNNRRGFSSPVVREPQEQNPSVSFDAGSSFPNMGNNTNSHKRKAEKLPDNAPPKQRVRTENYAASEQRATYDTRPWRERVQTGDQQGRINAVGCDIQSGGI